MTVHSIENATSYMFGVKFRSQSSAVKTSLKLSVTYIHCVSVWCIILHTSLITQVTYILDTHDLYWFVAQSRLTTKLYNSENGT